jgi:hypothetical protein
MTIAQALELLESFQGSSLTHSLARFEAEIVGLGADELAEYCVGRKIDRALLTSAATIKRIAAQINVIIHAAGILCSLPSILQPGERIERVSLGAGNTGKRFDLETNVRVAEYKFIDWRGGPESIRQNALFKDFFELAEYSTSKKKFMYVVGTQLPMKFLNSRRALASVLSRLPTILTRIRQLYGPEVSVVRDYYHLRKHDVAIVDVGPMIGRDVLRPKECGHWTRHFLFDNDHGWCLTNVPKHSSCVHTSQEPGSEHTLWRDHTTGRTDWSNREVPAR